MDSDTDEDQPLTKQMLSLIVENNALREIAFPYVTGWIVFNVLIMAMLIYISIRISLR